MLKIKKFPLRLLAASAIVALTLGWRHEARAQAIPILPGVGGLAGGVIELPTQILDTAIYGLGTIILNGGVNPDADMDAGMAGANAFPTGRLRWMNHDGYKSQNGRAFDTSAFHATEASAFASGYIGLPMEFLGGQLKFGAFGGYDDLNVKVSSGKSSTPQSGGGATSQSVLYGGYGLYVRNASYAMLTLSGSQGQTEQTGGDGSRVSFDVQGFAGSLVAGHVFSLTGEEPDNAHRSGAIPIKLDLRAGAAYQDAHGAQYVDPTTGHRLKASLDSWTGSASATLFSQFPMDGGAVFRPFIKGELRQQLSYNDALHEEWDTLTETVARELKFTQSDTSAVVEAGFDYALPGVTFTAAVYDEMAADRENLGFRIGLSIKLN
jgi:outer membrane autotransporter protein